ncbi:uncharacterized protein TRAVEDRAFT_53271 [Trametes versicolor FP-101664 SS1]|uniref:uncharacterized protein n=1 Tax=Trametes versicolor (strain FP-101664) TaxID=717944 RepID=UPI0004622F4A|nr:uncharacterized protein TRAVEDRAFT_53271 [Trametes versicolor FP-101664 SS1]EIW52832.1 hypothetical protein TRAVEDRAFT_53271 [Trametes versicolor FP-101664 SS1]
MPTAATPDPTLRLLVDSWTSHAGRGSFTSVIARVEDDTTGVTFTLPNDYADLAASRERWEGWLEVINHPTGQGMFPASTTDRQRAALRGLARALIFFSIEDARGERKRDWPHFLNHIREVAAREGLTGERQPELVADWARTEYQASSTWRSEQRARDGRRAASAGADSDPDTVRAREVHEAVSTDSDPDSVAEMGTTAGGYNTDSSVPSLMLGTCHTIM